MEKETRNNIQSATQKARSLLEKDYAEQLAGQFDIRMNGEIASEAGEHLDERQRLIRQKIVATIHHLQPQMGSAAAAVDRYRREVAFTTLNRFVALKMLESRKLVQECISKGEQSSGFREFTGLAPGLAELPDKGYRLYLESLFDEIGQEVRVLFDRLDPVSFLWPRRPALLELLEILNGTELATVWGEDETIGWVYQYFNRDEERKQMRAESQAPRNSRELAVRNQFFTPRYVVEFLTDNTLGRIWYEMRQGNTRLVEECDYLVRRPVEVFLEAGETAPESLENSEAELSQEELLNQPVYIPFRPLKDPRDLKVLDPACGSGHFLLYAFDLLLTIYEESWALENAPHSEITGRTLQEDYASFEDFQAAIPSLILRHNLHGVEIDPRAAQIASLALWMRSQRAYQDMGFSRNARPQIQKTNVVVAEPMPGDENLVEEFAETLYPPVVGDLFRRIVKEMKLAGEAGSLLKIEESIASTVTEAREQYQRWQQELSKGYLPGFEPTTVQGELDLSGIDDVSFFQEMEGRIIGALKQYAEKAQNGQGFQRRLFAEDAARGFGFIDLCRRRYDSVLMNPPFGDSTQHTREYINQEYKSNSSDLGACSVILWVKKLEYSGLLGVLANRTLLAVQGFNEWRLELLRNHGLRLIADLGHRVLDATVEVAMFVIDRDPNPITQRAGFINILGGRDKETSLQSAFKSIEQSIQWKDTNTFACVMGTPFAYWVPSSLLQRFDKNDTLNSLSVSICQGTATADDFRFYRLRWEVSNDRLFFPTDSLRNNTNKNYWLPITKGGEYQLWWDDIHLVQNWYKNGKEIKNFVNSLGKLKSRPQNLDRIGREALTYPYRTASAFCLRYLPEDASISVGGWGVFPPSSIDKETILAVYNTRFARYFLEVLLGQGDAAASGGTAARNHVAASVGGIPWIIDSLSENVPNIVRELISLTATSDLDETALFCRFGFNLKQEANSWSDLANKIWQEIVLNWQKIASLYEILERNVEMAYKFTNSELKAIEEDQGVSIFLYEKRHIEQSHIVKLFNLSVEELVSMVFDKLGGKRFVVKKAFFINRKIDLICHFLEIHPESLLNSLMEVDAKDAAFTKILSEKCLSWLFGYAVNRFSLEDNIYENLSVPTDGLAEESSRKLEGGKTILVDDAGHPENVISCVNSIASKLWGNDKSESFLSEICVEVGESSEQLSNWYRKNFFKLHIGNYSKSRRKAPIYWQLATPTASYSLWLYYHRFTRDTFYKALNDFVKPKLEYEERKLSSLTQSAGNNPTASQRKEIAAQETFVRELRTFRDEIEMIAPLWNPNLNDGVIINFAPLWRLVPQNRSWQKECKACWDKLLKGDYDWAHLALHLWPERVIPKCQTDRSLAIAHDLEDIFWQEDDKGKWHPRTVEPATVENLIQEHTSAAVKDALKRLLEAPEPAGNRSRRTRRKTSSNY